MALISTVISMNHGRAWVSRHDCFCTPAEVPLYISYVHV